MGKFYIYFHYTLDTNELFYIGKGTNNRAYSKESRNIYWKRVVKKHNYIVVIKKSLISESLAFKYEKYFISKLNPKCNLTPGGAGGNTKKGYSKYRKNKFKKKCSEKRLEYWKKLTKEERKRQNKHASEVCKNMWKNMDSNEKSLEQKRRGLCNIAKK